MKKRVLSAVMALVMLTTMLPVQALAAELDSAARTDSAPQTETAASASVEFVPVDEPEDEPAAEPENQPKDEPADEAPQTPAASAAPVSDTAPQADTSSGDFTYTTSNGAVTITGYTGTATEITIPSTIDGATVTTIGGNAFNGNKTLTKIILPEGVTTIGAYAFSGCTSLTDIVLPEGLTTIGERIFLDCTALTALTIPSTLVSAGSVLHGALGDSSIETLTFAEGITKVPDWLCDGAPKLSTIHWPKNSIITEIGYKAFSYCSSLTSVDLPGSVTSLGNNAFIGCSALERATLPSVTSIGSSAFNGCTALTSVTMPSVTTIRVEAFRGCTALKNVQLPEGLTNIGERIFWDCTALTALTIPSTLVSAGSVLHGALGDSSIETLTFAEGITKVPDWLCDGAPKLSTIHWPKNSIITEIGYKAFSYCRSLTSVDLPGSITKIGDLAFEECTALESLVIPDSVTSIAGSAFTGCTSLTLYTQLNSTATIFAIDNSITFVADDSKGISGTILNRSKTRYYFDTGSINTNGCLPFTAVVSIPAETFANLTNPKVTIRIPTGTELDETSIKVNGEALTGENAYNYTEPKLTIPLTAAEITIRFYVKVQNSSNLVSYAVLTASGIEQQIIGVVNEPPVGLSIVGPERTSKTNITLSGIAPAGAAITLKQNGETIKTVTANKVGSWSCALTLPDTVGALYTFAASCTASGTSYSAACQVYYETSTPTVTGFTLQVEGHGMQTIDLLDCAAKNITPKVGYYLTCPEYRFDITFENPESLETVYVTSTKNGVKKVMEATYDASVGHYVAVGYFDEDNHSYMPGNIRVEYNLKSKTPPASENFNVQQYKDSNVTATPTSTSETEMTGSVNLSGLGSALGELGLNYALKLHDNYKGTSFGELYTQADEALGWYKYIIPGEDGKSYFAALDYTDPTTYTMFIGEGLNIADKVYSFKISATDFGTSEYVRLFDAAEKISQYSTAVSLLGKTFNIVSDTNDLRDDILRSSMSTEQKEKALKQANELQSDRMMYVLVAATLPAIVAAGGAMTGPALVFSAMMGIMGIAAEEIWKLRMAQIKGDGCNVDWYMDPSGYVLDADTGLPVANAKMTAFYIPLNDQDPDFYTIKPTEADYTNTSKVKEWIAGDYGQNNPIYTDGNGWYKWDVPEGWWFVLCEKEGYQVTRSDWVPVAPPQTEVDFWLERIYGLGDVNGDEDMNALDMQCLYEYLTKAKYTGNEDIKTESWQMLMLDINCDGSIDVYDLQRLYEAVSGSNEFVKPDKAA